MTLIKTKLGNFIELVDRRNEKNEFGEDSVRGISTSKSFISTKADLDGVKLTSYKVILPGEFSYVADTSRRGDKIGLAYAIDEPCIISSIYTVFKVKDETKLSPFYLFMFFNRPEFDRYARFNSWGSARETFSWEEMCDIDIELPDIKVQEKFVDIYKSMVENQKAYETGLDDLKLVCDVYIEDLRRNMPCEEIDKYIVEYEKRNKNVLSKENIRGIAITKNFAITKADTDNISISNYKVVEKNCFAFNPNTARMGDKLAIALNKEDSCLVSAIYPTFYTKAEKLLPEYLMMWLSRNEFDRYVRFNSWGSARETFNMIDMKKVKVPIPDINVQQSIVDIYNAYIERKEINEKLKQQIKDLCPILIRGSLQE